MPRVAGDHKSRILASVVVDELTGCWNWQKFINPKGYGHMGVKVDGVHVVRRAHRVAYEAFRGPIPDGMVLDHLCRNRACVNPDHLEAVTNGVNLMRGETFQARQSAQTHCLRDHPLSGDNLVNSSDGHRRCKACLRMREAERRRRRTKQGTA